MGIKKQKDGFAIIETKIADTRGPCKNCKKRNRRDGSAYCKECAVGYKVQKFNQERVQRRVDEAYIKK